MKFTSTLCYLILFLLCYTGCNNHTADNVLLREAENLIIANPDSALLLLNSIAEPAKLPEKDYATWCLLFTQAQDKNYIPHTTDSLINVAVDYFEQTNCPESLAKALYYKGRIYEDHDSNKIAATLFLKAWDVGAQTTDYRQLFLITSGLGELYAYRRLTDKALHAYTETLRYAIAAQDSSYISFAHSYLGRVYGLERKWKESLQHYETAQAIGKQLDNKKAYFMALKEYIGICTEANQLEKIDECINQIEQIYIEKENSRNKSSAYLTLGDAYRRLKQMDKAICYLKKALETENLYILRSTYRALYLLYRNTQQYEQSIYYNDLYYNIADSIARTDNKNAILAIEAKYNNEKLKNEKMELQLSNSKRLNTIVILLLCSTLILLIIGWLYNRKRKSVVSLNKKLNLLEEKAAQYKKHIHSNENKLIELSIQLEEKKKEKSRMPELETLIRERQALESTNRKLEHDLSIINHEKQSLNRQINTDPVLIRIKQHPKYLSDTGWEECIGYTDVLHDNFTKRLKDCYPQLTEQELHVCVLMKWQFSDTDIATILGIEKESVIKRKQRLRTHIAPGKSWKKGEFQNMMSMF